MRKDKTSDENFTSLLSAIDRYAVAADQEFLKQLRERSAREFAAAAPDASANTPKSIRIAALRSMVMKSPITKLATAAIVAIACLIGLSLWKGTESGIALADVLARVEKVKAFRYKSLLKIGSDDPNNAWSFETLATVLTSQEYGSKTTYEETDPNGGKSPVLQYFLPQKKTWIIIRPKQKRYRRIEVDDAQVGEIQKLNAIGDPFRFLKEIAEGKYKTKSLGRSIFDGNEVEVFQITDPNYYAKEIKRPKNPPQVDVKIWVDVKTRLPVRYEEFTSALTDMLGNRMTQQQVLYDFQWDVPVDASEFEPVIPDDYTLAPKKPPSEENAIKGLKLHADLSGHYPERLDWEGSPWLEIKKMDTPAATRLQEEVEGLTGKEKEKGLRDITGPWVGLRMFYEGLARKDPAYYGKTVIPKDADKVLMRWKVSDNEYRVIYGDLHAETVTPEKLAELEAALPK